MQRNIGESHRHENEQKKPDTGNYVLCDFIYMRFKDRQN